MATNLWVDKQKVVYSCSAILFGSKKEWSSDTSYKDEPWRPYAKWKKPATYRFTLSEMSTIGKCIGTESKNQWLPCIVMAEVESDF